MSASDIQRLAALKAQLVDHIGDASPASDEDIADEVVSRRNAR